MATARQITNSALRKIGRLGGGREPRLSDQTDVLAALQGIYTSWIASGAFGRLTDVVPTGTSYVARGNERILRTSEAQMSVTLPELVSDGWVEDYGRPRQGYYGTVITVDTDETTGVVTVDVQPGQPISSAQTPRDGWAVVIADREGGQVGSWLYDGTAKRWERLDLLQLDSQAPRSLADPEGLSAVLALEIADTFGAEVGPTTQMQAARFKQAMTHRYGMRREPVCGSYI